MSRRIAVLALLALLLGPTAVSLAQGGALQYRGPIYSGGELDYQPAIIRLQPGGQLLVVFERIDPATFMGDFYATISSDGGQTWTVPQPAVASPLNERHPALLQLAADSFVLFYLLADDGGGANSRIHRATSTDGLAWTDQGAIDLGWATTGELNPSVIREADGALTMTYQRGPSYIARSTDDGATWDTLRTQVSDGSAPLPRLAKRERDGLYIVTYQVNMGGNRMAIYAKTSQDPYNWSVPQVSISTVINSHDSQPIVLEDGTLLVAYAMTPVNYFDLFYRTSCDDGATWSDPVQVTNDPTHYDTQPHPLLQGTPGRVLLTWSHQKSTAPYQDHDVWIDTDLAIPPALESSFKAVRPAIVDAAGLLTYTLRLANEGLGPTVARLADPLPADTAYDGGLWASAGQYGYDPASATITWTGMISACGAVTLTFRASTALDVPDGQVLTNTALLTDGVGVAHTLVATAIADTLPPSSAILDPLDGAWISATTCLISGVASDTVAGVDAVAVSVDGSLWQPALGAESWSTTWTGLGEGPHNARSRAVDRLGHLEEPGPGITFTVDTIPPALLAHRPAGGEIGVPLSATVVLTFSEPIVPGTLTYTVAPDPGGWSVLWNAAATAAYLAHADFAAGQSYTVTVAQARDRAGNSLAPVAWSFTTVLPCAPVEILSVTTAISRCVVTWDADLAGEPPFTYTWGFGAWGSRSEPTPTVDFGAGGTYPYSLTVSNCLTASAAAAGTVTVTCAPLCQGPESAQFTYWPAWPLVNETVAFSGSVVGGTPPFSSSWSFGDGSAPAAGLSVGHVFTGTGSFTVTLAVTNQCGRAESAQAIVVSPYRIYLPLVLRTTGG